MRILPLLSLIAIAAIVFGGFTLFRRIPAVAIGAPALQAVRATPASTQEVTIEVHQGDGADVIAQRLKQAGVITSTELFTELTALEGVQNGLAAGQYQFTPNMPASEVIARLHAGNTGAIRVTIPEGRRVEEVAAILQKAGVVSAQDFINAAKTGPYHYSFLAGLPAGTSLEGFLFPDTYNFPKHNNAQDVVNTMLKDFDQRLTPALRSAIQQQGLNLLQGVTLASIVEREAEVASERPTIASVFYNRLHQHDLLRTDPTVQYALSQDPKNVAQYGWWKQQLTLADLKVDSPYNTYLHAGLPPGPIANPGLASIEAVAHPAHTKYLYFVAKGDGTHAFAETFAQHEANIAKYQH